MRIKIINKLLQITIISGLKNHFQGFKSNIKFYNFKKL